MKTKLIFIIILFLVLTPFVYSAELTDVKEGVDDLRETKENVKTIQEEKLNEKYLTQEWTNLLKENKYLNQIYKINPVLKFIIGYEFEISWAFITAIILFIGFFTILYPLSKIYLKDDLSAIGITFILTSLCANSISKKLLEILAESVKSTFQAVLSPVIIIVAIILLSKISKIIAKETKDAKKSQENKEIKEKVEQQQEVLEGLSEGLEETDSTPI
jgi:hypothetical protein